MKITIVDKDNMASVDHSGVTAPEVLQECLDCMLGMGFQSESVKEAVLGKAEEYGE